MQPRVDKREFKAPKKVGTLGTPKLELEAPTNQPEKADVGIVELNPRSLALVAN